jgi:hypothetical protein
MDLIGIAALLLSFLLWLINAGPIRRMPGLESPSPLAPVYAAGTQEGSMRRNPEIHEVLSPVIAPRTSWVSVGVLETEIAKGKRSLTHEG